MLSSVIKRSLKSFLLVGILFVWSNLNIASGGGECNFSPISLTPHDINDIVDCSLEFDDSDDLEECLCDEVDTYSDIGLCEEQGADASDVVDDCLSSNIGNQVECIIVGFGTIVTENGLE